MGGAGLGGGLEVAQPCFEALAEDGGRGGDVRVDLGPMWVSSVLTLTPPGTSVKFRTWTPSMRSPSPVAGQVQRVREWAGAVRRSR
ncbi:hypothetical protein AMK15_29495 [Streptomyces sp. MJM1172]|nr:hypothetical protein AMK15_29495 [Streptomyces sp. MJM1172]